MRTRWPVLVTKGAGTPSGTAHNKYHDTSLTTVKKNPAHIHALCIYMHNDVLESSEIALPLQSALVSLLT